MNERTSELIEQIFLSEEKHRFNELVSMSLQMMSNDPIERRMLPRQQGRSQV